MTKRKIYTAAIVIFLSCLFIPLKGFAFSYGTYSKILNKYVHRNRMLGGIKMNVVDYKGLHKEYKNPSSDFNSLLKELSTFNPSTLRGRNARLAFWINVYNIGAINLVLMNYPVGSIRSLKINVFKNPWDKDAIKVNGRWYSLSYIEHNILLKKYGEKSSHFGIVCASVSCPDITIRLYTKRTVRWLLKKMGRRFIKNTKKGMRIDRAKNIVYLSKIFKFDKKNFGRGKADIIPFILPFVSPKESKDYLKNGTYKIEFMPYNWNLNRLK
ncbi:DUF547 domain-containing protein [Spirochaetota bacterium]